MRKLIIHTLLLAVVFISSALAEPFQVGVILPLTGEGSAFGKSLQNGIFLAQQDLPPTLAKQIEFVFEDDGMVSRNSLAAFERMTSIGKIQALISITSGVSNALAPRAESKKIPFISIASDGRISAGRKYVVNLLTTPEQEAKVLVEESARRGYKRIARFTTTQEGAFAIRTAFDNENEGTLEVVLDEDYPLDNKDLLTFVTKVRKTPDLDGLFSICLPGHCGHLARLLREQGVTLPLFGVHTFEDINEVRHSAGAMIGQWYATASDPSSKFTSRFEAKFGKDNMLWVAAHAYDAVMLLAGGMKLGRDKETINKYLHEVKDFKGVLGTFSATGDNRFLIPAMIKVITADGFSPI